MLVNYTIANVIDNITFIPYQSILTLTVTLGETFEGEFVPSRPFRVNAGPVHSYVLMGDQEGSTKYLCEVKAGDLVRVVDGSYYEGSEGSNGEKGKGYVGRAVTVGRCKIESRPMLMVSYSEQTEYNLNNCEGDDNVEHIRDDKETLDYIDDSSRKSINGQIFLQQAETVRLVSPCSSKGFKTLPVTQAIVGNEILVLRNDFGTHVGRRISARVTEK